VIVVVHQTVAVADPAVLADNRGKDVEKLFSIEVVIENV
jgi:hypothetical protein